VLTIPQLCLVLGLPGVGFWIVRQHLNNTPPRSNYATRDCTRGTITNVGAGRGGGFTGNCVAQVHIMVFVLALAFFLNERGQPYQDDEDRRRDRRLNLHKFRQHRQPPTPSLLITYQNSNIYIRMVRRTSLAVFCRTSTCTNVLIPVPTVKSVAEILYCTVHQ
jgi:hypothetical protein